MYDRIVASKFKPEKLDEATKIMRESIIPAQKEQKGWKGTMFMITIDRSWLEFRVVNRTLTADGYAMAASNAVFFIQQFRYCQLFSLHENALRAHLGA